MQREPQELPERRGHKAQRVHKGRRASRGSKERRVTKDQKDRRGQKVHKARQVTMLTPQRILRLTAWMKPTSTVSLTPMT